MRIRTLFWGLVLFFAADVSVARQRSKPAKTLQDSMAYAFGVDVGNVIWTQIDSTLNPDFIVRGILDLFANKASISVEQAGICVQHYVTEMLPKMKAEKNEAEAAVFFAALEQNPMAKKSPTGLVIVTEDPGSGLPIELGDTISLHSTLFTLSGKKLLDSRPLTVTYWPLNELIEGFFEGLSGLRQGARSTFYIPHDLAYAEQGFEDMIGPKQSLKFEVEVIKVIKPIVESDSNYEQVETGKDGSKTDDDDDER